MFRGFWTIGIALFHGLFVALVKKSYVIYAHNKVVKVIRTGRNEPVQYNNAQAIALPGVRQR